MSNLLLIPSLLVIAAALGLRWWFAVRVLSTSTEAACKAGIALRQQALTEWNTLDRRTASSRVGMLRFGLATPPLSLLVATFAVVVGKIPIFPAMAVVLAITALASALGILTLPGELTAIQRCSSFPDSPEPVREAAMAEAWNQSIPPALRALFRK